MTTATKIHPAAIKSAERKAEWDYRFSERLGLITDGRVPTEREIQIAKVEADEAVSRLAF